MLGYSQGKLLDSLSEDYVVFDLETTGFFCPSSEIIEISALRVRNCQVVNEFSSLIKPKRSISPRITDITGITNSMVSRAPSIVQVLPSFIEFVGDDILAGHNIHTFDMKFLYMFCANMYGKLISNDYFDSLVFAKKQLSEPKSKKLTDLASYYSICTDGAHRALNDCHMNHQVIEKMRHYSNYHSNSKSNKNNNTSTNRNNSNNSNNSNIFTINM